MVLLLVLNTSGAYLMPATPAGPQAGYWQVLPTPDYCRHAIFKYQAKCKNKTIRLNLVPSLPPAPSTAQATPSQPRGEWICQEAAATSDRTIKTIKYFICRATTTAVG